MTAEEMWKKFETMMCVKEASDKPENMLDVHFSKEHEEKMKEFFDDLRKKIDE